MSLSLNCICGAPIAAPVVGERWWNVNTGDLYEVTGAPWPGRIYWCARRVDRPERPGGWGCDPTVTNAMWPDAIRAGHWKRDGEKR